MYRAIFVICSAIFAATSCWADVHELPLLRDLQPPQGENEIVQPYIHVEVVQDEDSPKITAGIKGRSFEITDEDRMYLPPIMADMYLPPLKPEEYVPPRGSVAARNLLKEAEITTTEVADLATTQISTVAESHDATTVAESHDATTVAESHDATTVAAEIGTAAPEPIEARSDIEVTTIADEPTSDAVTTIAATTEANTVSDETVATTITPEIVPETTIVAVEETPTPKTRVGETPAPETPAPETPAPETPAPETPAPETPAPETLAAETPAPEVPATETLPPKTPAPEVVTTIKPVETPEATPEPAPVETTVLPERLSKLLQVVSGRALTKPVLSNLVEDTEAEEKEVVEAPRDVIVPEAVEEEPAPIEIENKVEIVPEVRVVPPTKMKGYFYPKPLIPFTFRK